MDRPICPSAGANPFLDDPAALNVPWIESPFFAPILERSNADEKTRELARRFRRDGFLVLDGLIEPELVERVAARYEWLFDADTEFPGVTMEQEELLTRDASRKQDAWRICPEVRELACHEPLLELLRFLYRREPVPFQTLNFVRGTEQSLHSDAMHFSSIPGRFMCGIWVALEDTNVGNGPLRYVPGSHRLPEVQLHELGRWYEDLGGALGSNYERFCEYILALLESRGAEVEELTVKKGSALLWASNLLHGGAPILDPGSTRWSQVTHYYFEDCTYYTPAFSDPALGKFHLRSVHDIRRDRPVPHMLNGVELVPEPAGHGQYRLCRDLDGRFPQFAGGGKNTALESGLVDYLNEVEGERQTMRAHVETLEDSQRHLTANVELLQAERTQRLAQLSDLTGERDTQRGRIQNLEQIREEHLSHIDHLEGRLNRILGHPGFRALTRARKLLVREPKASE